MDSSSSGYWGAEARDLLEARLPTTHGRGFDRLPHEATAPIDPTLVRSLEIPELKRAFARVTDALPGEAELADAPLADRLGAPLSELAG